MKATLLCIALSCLGLSDVASAAPLRYTYSSGFSEATGSLTLTDRMVFSFDVASPITQYGVPINPLAWEFLAGSFNVKSTDAGATLITLALYGPGLGCFAGNNGTVFFESSQAFFPGDLLAKVLCPNQIRPMDKVTAPGAFAANDGGMGWTIQEIPSGGTGGGGADGETVGSTTVPEPATGALLALGLAGLAKCRRRQAAGAHASR